MRVIAARLKSAGVPGVTVPEPLMALSSPQLLVMQRMPGARILPSPMNPGPLALKIPLEIQRSWHVRRAH